MSCWYSLDSSCGVLSDEYPFARVSDFFSVFWHHFILAKLAASRYQALNPVMLQISINKKLSGLTTFMSIKQILRINSKII